MLASQVRIKDRRRRGAFFFFFFWRTYQNQDRDAQARNCTAKPADKRRGPVTGETGTGPDDINIPAAPTTQRRLGIVRTPPQDHEDDVDDSRRDKEK